MKRTTALLCGCAIAVSITSGVLHSDTLYTTDNKVYEGKMVAFKYGVIYFNVYKFGKYDSKKNFPLSQIWKIEFNEPKTNQLQSPFETESKYQQLRRGKRTRTLNLNANQQWLNTGITLKQGQTILFSASGSIFISGDHEVYQNGELEVTWNKNKPMPTHPTGALIAKISESGEPFFIGSNKAPFQVEESGLLFIGINDCTFNDNQGQFRITIYY